MKNYLKKATLFGKMQNAHAHTFFTKKKMLDFFVTTVNTFTPNPFLFVRSHLWVKKKSYSTFSNYRICSDCQILLKGITLHKLQFTTPDVLRPAFDEVKCCSRKLMLFNKLFCQKGATKILISFITNRLAWFSSCNTDCFLQWQYFRKGKSDIIIPLKWKLLTMNSSISGRNLI